MTLGRVLLLVFGSIFTLLALALLAGGGVLVWADTKRDADGFFTTSVERFETTSFALVAEDLDVVSGAPSWVFGSGRFGDIRLAGSSSDAEQAIFIGIGEQAAAAVYLDGVERDVVTDADFDPFRLTFSSEPGEAEPGAPGDETFWEVSVEGVGTQTLEWGVKSGTWTVVVMNADASPNVSVDLAAGANIGFVLALGIGFVSGGALLLLGGVTMIYFGARRRPREPPAAGGGVPTAEAGSPAP